MADLRTVDRLAVIHRTVGHRTVGHRAVGRRAADLPTDSHHLDHQHRGPLTIRDAQQSIPGYLSHRLQRKTNILLNANLGNLEIHLSDRCISLIVPFSTKGTMTV